MRDAVARRIESAGFPESGYRHCFNDVEKANCLAFVRMRSETAFNGREPAGFPESDYPFTSPISIQFKFRPLLLNHLALIQII